MRMERTGPHPWTPPNKFRCEKAERGAKGGNWTRYYAKLPFLTAWGKTLVKLVNANKGNRDEKKKGEAIKRGAYPVNGEVVKPVTQRVLYYFKKQGGQLGGPGIRQIVQI